MWRGAGKELVNSTSKLSREAGKDGAGRFAGLVLPHGDSALAFQAQFFGQLRLCQVLALPELSNTEIDRRLLLSMGM